MANMSYCRFRNTLDDLSDCRYALGDDVELGEEESRAMKRLLILCQEIAADYEYEIEEWLEKGDKGRKLPQES